MRNKSLLVLALITSALLAWRFAPLSQHIEMSNETAPSHTVQEIYFGPPRSLAVLPPQPADLPEGLAWFPDGFAIHLAQRLMEYSRLLVISPNSSLRFRPDEVAPRIIAERLVARHLLMTESVMVGESLMLQAELWNAQKKSVVWSQSYSADPGQWYELLNLLERDVAAAMLSNPAPRLAPKLNDEAWLPYLEGLENLAEFEYLQATHAFDRSRAANDAFVPAWVAGARSRLSGGSQNEDPAFRVDEARQQVRQALLLDSENGQALALDSYIRRDIDWSFDQAMVLATRAVAALPGDSAVLQLAAQAALSAAEPGKAVTWLEQAVARDPLNLGLRLALGHAQEFAGNDDAALFHYRQTLELNENMPAAGAYRARIKLLQGKPEVALQEAEQEADPFWSRYARILARSALGQHDQALELLEAFILEDGYRAACQVAEIHAFRGEADLAFEWLDKAVEYRDAGIPEIAGNRFFEPLYGDPRWSVLLARLGLPLLDSDPDSD